ncbi:hypothetical protein ATE84_1138 [Aquimarina sp. MAR_2010_214]|uniref:contractile injection system tape measure protein n=1 Tax=Aquimarina sp. MAR_2010_214 TaxID=1250026 RepID=UPI000C6FDE7D|nr:contractile injection system tape measure protein [Aquimarina sp. MAR_2010_214]PKV49121.1 hypothetical protein ATE84_1138 [Aquimarina sp. MAR_2010_214]
MNTPKHIINKILFEVNTSDTKIAYYLKDNLDTFIKQSMLPVMESCFNSISENKNHNLRFDKLELNIDSVNVKDQVQLQLDILKSLQKQLLITQKSEEGKTSDSSFSIVNKEKNDVDTFFHFLKTGQHPWWNSNMDLFSTEFIANLVSNKSFKTKLKKTVQNKTVRQRLIYQFEDKLLSQILGKKGASKNISDNISRNQYWEVITKYVMDENITSLKKGLGNLFLKVRSEEVEKDRISNEFLSLELKKLSNSISIKTILLEKVKEEVLKAFKSKKGNKISEKNLVTEIQKIVKEQIDKKTLAHLVGIIIKESIRVQQIHLETITKEIVSITSAMISKKLDFSEIKEMKTLTKDLHTDKQQEEIQIDTGEYESEVYIKNAGLVLVHPYLNLFFEAAKMTDDKGNIKPDEREKAVHLLHYLATKDENPSESSLVFEKFLCGFPIHKPIQRTVKLSKNLKKEAEDLLNSVLKYWGALKNTSPDGLREGFIKREGKLVLGDESKYRVIVEKKTQDILLEKLPWNHTLIRLPWIDKLVFVEW